MELDWRIAALIGGGLTDERIARELNVEQKIVQRVRRDVPEDEDLSRIVQTARKKLMGKMLDGAEKALDRAVSGLDGYEVKGADNETVKVDCPPGEAVAVFRELAKVTGLGEEKTSSVTEERTKKIDFSDPKVREAGLKALQQSALEAEAKMQARFDRRDEAKALPEHKEGA